MVDEVLPEDERSRRVNMADALFWIQNKVIKEANLGFVVSEEQIRSLHFICMKGLLESAGSYRSVELHPLGNHQPPPARDVSLLMRDFVVAINDKIKSGGTQINSIDVSAFALWRINWIHPFSNGNGRTSRLFAYFVMCMCVGNLLRGSGRNLVSDQLGSSLHGDYIKALKKVDETFARTGKEDLLPLQQILAIAVIKQLE